MNEIAIHEMNSDRELEMNETRKGRAKIYLSKLLKWFGIVGLIVIMAMGIIMAFYRAHIRPASLRNTDVSDIAINRGRALLGEAESAHGFEQWQNRTTTDILAVDDWVDMMGNLLINPFSIPRQEIKIQLLNGTWNSRLELIEDSHAKEVWGIQSGNSYKRRQGEEPVFKPDKDVEFFLPTYQYFFEFPFHVKSADIVIDIGESQFEGKTYDRVFATWKSLEPISEVDQYIVWIDKDTKLVRRIEYTIREMGDFFMGSTNFEDYKLVDSIMVPHQLDAHAIMPGGIEMLMHTITVEEVRFDTMKEDDFKSDPTLQISSDKI